MSKLSHPDLAAASGQGADVLTAIRRLLAQDARDDDAADRNGALRRRLIGTRRHGSTARGNNTDAAMAGADALCAPDPEVPPLRLADTQRVRPSTQEDGDDPDSLWRVEVAGDLPARWTAPVLSQAGREDAAIVAPQPAVLTAEPLAVAMDTAPHPAIPQPKADEQPSGFAEPLPPASDASLERLRELLTFQAWVTQDAACASAAPAAPAGPAPVPAPPAVQLDASDSGSLRTLIRETLREELAGESGHRLSEAIHALTRRAVAGALADIARDMGALHGPDGADLH